MNKILKISFALLGLITVISCADNTKPNFQYMPNMYEPVGYETYGEYEVFPGGLEAMLPVEGSIPRGWQPYDYPNTTKGLNEAKASLKSPLEVTEENLDDGKE